MTGSEGPSNPYRNLRPALVNISLRTFDNDPLVGALESVINGLVLDSPGWTGIPVIVSANNQRSRYSHTSPARMAYRNETACAARIPDVDPPCFVSPGRVISVGGIAENDFRWQCNRTEELCNPEPVFWDGTFPRPDPVDGGSNYGYTVDIYAPAHNIESAHILSPGAFRIGADKRAGTSFAAPFVSGIVARMLQVTPTLTPLQVWQQLQADATDVGHEIDSVTGNRMVVFRAGSPVCFPEYP